ncbi:MAG: APC family permease [Hamadaea sp.]|uniref:APC family permease n=1 Tax=Hamadaea sp. TaxID=2024425 RepID=UPI00185C8D2A|nr:APC family permease [Hamadaea sp.]NUT21557.1 APC family permease [Hamadaea sp.]
MERLARRLGPVDAVVIGLGSMIGAGVFAAFAPAARAAGSLLLAGLAVAAVVAYCNATASAQLAAQYPTSGGTYVYGRERLGEWWGYVAGWGFVVGKTASCAAMALTFAAYAVPPAWQRPAAVVAVLALAAVNYRGVTRTARLAMIIVVAVLAVLAVVAAAGLLGPAGPEADGGGSAYGVLQSAGLLFFAFAGYARIATMGEEVREPQRTIPRAILTALALAVAVYAVIGVALLHVLGPQRLASSTAPLADAVHAAGWDWAAPAVRAGAALASLGALLALIAGVGRTALAMARHDDLPRWLSAVHPRYAVPHRAEIALAAVVCVLVLTVDLRGAIGFSSFGVLVYYLIANLAAWTQTGGDRRYPRALQALGAAGCVALVATLPWPAVVGGLAVFAVGLLYRALRLRLFSARS